MIKIISDELVEQARALICDAQRITLVSHISPDGDAVGSILGMHHLLRELGKETKMVLPNFFPDSFNWMPDSDKILIHEADSKAVKTAFDEADLVICIDFNSRKRINGVRPFLDQTKAKTLLIDHHIGPEEFATVTISYPDASSACMLVYSLIAQMGWHDKITKACAECIYVGMMTDTGNFSYASQDPDIYIIISELLELGIDKDEIYRRVNNNYSESRMRMMGYCLLNKMKIYPEQHTAVISLTQSELQQFNHKVGDTEGFVNIPLSIAGITRSIFVRKEDKKVKLSFRSQGNVPVNTIAQEHFNGGGHMNAAGGESYLSLEDTLKKLEKVILSIDN